MAEEVTERRRRTDETLDNVLESVQAMTMEAEMLRHEVRVIEDSSQRDRKILRWLGIVTFLLLPLVALTAWNSAMNRDNGDVIRDCTTPSGQCAQRSARASAAMVQSITFRTEAERLRTEITVAEAQANQVAVDARRVRLADIEARIKESDQAILKARQ